MPGQARLGVEIRGETAFCYQPVGPDTSIAIRCCRVPIKTIPAKLATIIPTVPSKREPIALRPNEIVPLSEPVAERRWAPVPPLALVAWLLFLGAFMYQAARGSGVLLLMDSVFVPIHEAGHLLFHYFGLTIGVAGGTFLQLFIPFALAAYFARHRAPQAVVFCGFFFFEQFLAIATYMADARAMQMPLLAMGESEYAIHDWNYLFSKMGVLQYDTVIATCVRSLGWLGMIGLTLWLLWRGLSAGFEGSAKSAE
jgi:hypothetical protein